MIHRTKHITIQLLFLLLAATGYAQQTALYGQYFINPFLYNPAAAGQSGHTRAFMLYRNQWVNVNGAPETFALTIDGKLKNQPVGLGLSIVNDVNNVIGQTQFGLSGNYTAKLAPGHALTFGLTTQAMQNRIFFERIQAEDIDDPNLLSNIDQRTAFEMKAGASYRWKSLQVGFAADQLLQNGVTFQSSSQFQQLDFNFVRHYIGSARYRFTLSRHFDLEPLLLTRIVQGLPTQVDVNVIGTWQKRVWLAVAYRHEVGVGFSLGFEIEKQLTIGYAYEVPTTDLDVLGSYSHELLVGWRFRPAGKNQQAAGTNSRASTPKTRKLSKLERENAAQYQEIDELRQRNERIAQQLEASNQRFDQQQEEIDLLKEQLLNYQQEVGTIRQRATETIETLEEDTHGNFYVVIGAFKTLKASKTFQQVIIRKNGPETKIVLNQTGTFYFIYTQRYETLSDASEQLETVIGEHIADEITGNPWIYFEESK